MSLEGWWGNKVIFYLPSKDERRHKSWCEYYESNTKRCAYICSSCFGSSFCEYYKKANGVGPVKKDDIPKDVASEIEIISSEGSAKEAAPKQKARNDTIPGHQPSFGEALLGKVVIIMLPNKISEIGVVIEESRERITIEKDSGDLIKFERKTTVKQKTLWVLDNIRDAYADITL